MGRPRSYHVFLSKCERRCVKHLQKKVTSLNARTRLAIILAADENSHKTRLTYTQIAHEVGSTVPTVIETLKAFTTEGLAEAITPKRNPNSNTARLKADGEAEAKIIALACSTPPVGHARWTVKLLADASAAILEESLSPSSVGRILKRNELRPHVNEYWCIPPEQDGDFVAHMEDVLDIYQIPHDPLHPLWCLDEKPYQLLDESRQPIPMKPGKPERDDAEYRRNGTVCIFVLIQPHTGRIIYFVEETRTAVDWAEKVKYLVDEIEPNAESITLVMDNLNTHTIGSLYKTFPPEEARRIAKKLDIHYTPKHGSWLNIAEIAIRIMTGECLDRRISGIDQLQDELKAWSDDYNATPTKIEWQFTSADAQIKLKRLYPDIKKCRKDRDDRRKAKSATESDNVDDMVDDNMADSEDVNSSDETEDQITA